VSTENLTERDWQRTVLDLAAMYHWGCYHTHDSRRSQPGFPDLVLWRERVVFAELKVPGGRLTPLQRQVLEGLRAAGGEVYVWWPQHLDEAREVLAPASAPKQWAVAGASAGLGRPRGHRRGSADAGNRSGAFS